MEHVLEELARLCQGAKIFSAGPFIKNGNILFIGLFGTTSKEVKTLLSPVF
jgi:hypothetical protein